MRSDDIPHTPDDKWVLNNDAYMKREAFAITYTFPKVAEVYSFTERNSRAEKNQKRERILDTSTCNYWCMDVLVTGRKRDVLDIASFVLQNGDIVAEVQQARKAANVLLLTTWCPLNKALQQIERAEWGEKKDEQLELEVPS